jgi:hypothetical protein
VEADDDEDDDIIAETDHGFEEENDGEVTTAGTRRRAEALPHE